MENTLVLIKPDGIKYTDKIIEMFYKNNLKINDYKVMNMTNELVYEHYSHLIDKPFFNDLKNYMTSGSIVAMILEGDNAILKVREIIGSTDPKKAKEGTIRNLYGTNATYNVVHASDSEESAEIEINRFFGKEKINHI